ncbi:dihydroxyacetone kinase subunit L [Devosia yakushimensis]|uniref:Dihydroxyacetone kinase subunit L n=1 Tax=Devosia yakushimensis TaxID=470028 RepID=A0ABQ5UFM3_9HYPH|nr:dihydroxyacetone kinase subunit L [Devosia yakushimensis]GLQ10565.1 dihydroxyacetone kinase subunit L [Devosia yakushimensis]
MTLTSSILRNTVSRIVAVLPSLEQELNEADSKLGDGDTGGMLARVVAAIDQAGPDDGADVGVTLTGYAKATVGATGSSLGTLIATALMTASRQTKGRSEVPWVELGTILGDARDAMSARGGANLGDKTVLDALDAVAKSIAGYDQPTLIHAAALTAAKATLEEYRDRPNKMGRARMFADASKGLDDPGMLAMVRVIEAIGS